MKIDIGRISPSYPEFYTLSQNVNSSSAVGRKFNLQRRWNRLSRLQKNLFALMLLVTLAILSLIIFFKLSVEQNLLNKNTTYFDVSTDVIESKKSKLKNDFGTYEYNFNRPQNEKQKAVVNAFKHAWTNYKQYAWGHDHLTPISKSYHDWFDLGLTIVDSLDTLLIMNLVEEFQEAKIWVKSSLDFDKDVDVNFFETTIRVLGGLLSAYHLAGEDDIFLSKARQLGDRLKAGFNTPSGIPYPDVNLMQKKPKMASWTPDSSLSEISSVQLEFRELSRLTGDSSYENLAFNVSLKLHELGCTKFDGLCPMYVNPQNGKFRDGAGIITTGARTDSFYEYLLKQWLQTGRVVDWLRDDFLAFVAGMHKQGLIRTTAGRRRLRFVGELLSEKAFSPKMDHLVCFLPGVLALAAYYKLPLSASHLHLAKDLARTCKAMYDTRTGLAPEIVHFRLANTTDGAEIFIKSADAHSLLRPEAVEAWFYLFRVTGDPEYQKWGWEMFQALEQHARVTNGYSSVRNVKQSPVSYMDKMESFFLAETLKYLFLLLADDQSLLPLDRFVFNTEAHPFPIPPNSDVIDP